jgi:polysaccharide pyruvyl transferase WcaK-like protein
MSRSLRIGILGPYSSRNFGDTSIQMAVISSLRRYFPDAELVGICPDPVDTEVTHGIPAFPLSGLNRDSRPGRVYVTKTGTHKRYARNIPRFMLRKIEEVYERVGATCSITLFRRLLDLLFIICQRFFRAVDSMHEIGAGIPNIASCCRSMDLLLISGSGQLDDFWGGPWKHPFSLLTWSSFSRLCGARVAVLGIGWDDLSTRLGRRFAFTALRLAHYRAFRDSGTLQKLSAAGLDLESHVCPDPAFGLPVPSRSRVENRQPVIMVCPISFRAWLRQPDASYSNYIESLIDSCRQWVREGYIVRIANSQTTADIPMVRELADRLHSTSIDSGRFQFSDTRSVSGYLEIARSADLVVASRLHALILAAVAETPMVAVSYGRKVSQLMADLRFGDYCLDLHGLKAEQLQATVARAYGDRKRMREVLLQLLPEYRKQLDLQYDNIKGLTVYGSNQDPAWAKRRDDKNTRVSPNAGQQIINAEGRSHVQ